MKKLLLSLWLVLLCALSTPASAQEGGLPVPYSQEDIDMLGGPQGTYQTEAYRSGRGGYSGGRRGYTPAPGARTPADNVRRTPATPAPGTAPPPARGGLGGILGGFAAGALLSSLLNPFGLFGGAAPVHGGFSILGILLWGGVLFFLYRLWKGFRRSS
ncbi:hypothetical protein [Paenibacillus ehimensis]|uniref:Uncharacterized protein n=1 Tax=Paenibacillus ehimensis TaxID=79264 RepID=A0ABT8VJQ8_9BACL|nr:hypothetical protein [Paenibacillus ehimensis]MDO3681229.1 hypothetical protein [Paenibacillus ehimensis]MEC0212819.1 hypothetical protein [Paenibacillus ehimensis]